MPRTRASPRAPRDAGRLRKSGFGPLQLPYVLGTLSTIEYCFAMPNDFSRIVNELLTSSEPHRTMGIPVDESSLPMMVSMGLPWAGRSGLADAFRDRMFVFSRPVEVRRTLSIASSRMGRRLDLETWWFDLLRTAVLHCHDDDEVLVTVEGSTTCDAVRRAAELFQKPRLHFRPLGKTSLSAKAEVDEWLKMAVEFLRDRASVNHKTATTVAVVSPPVSQTLQLRQDDDANTTTPPSIAADVPLADQLLLASSDRTYVLSMRKNGYVHAILKHQLQQSAESWRSILVASDSDGRLPDFTTDLPAGWIPWLVEPLDDDQQRPGGPSVRQLAVRATRDGYSIPALRRQGPIRCPMNDPISHPNEWLLHWTRPSTGPWPDESSDDYLDSLILRTDRSQRSALATLLRIVTDGVLRGSSTGIRGGYKVVSLTAVPLSEFRSRRTFRNHLNRFDFEPWGIAFRRSALKGLAQAVTYGSDDDWHRLPEQARPFFQKATSGGATNNVAEREWRVLNELVFDKFSSDDVCVFAPTQQDAELIAQHCRWGIVVTP